MRRRRQGWWRKCWTVTSPRERRSRTSTIAKREFPDAFALLTLEHVAHQCGKLLICVSADQDWVAYAAESTRLVPVKKLDDAIALFYEAHVADAMVERWRRMEATGDSEDVLDALESPLEELEFWPTAHADTYFDAEPLSAVAQYILSDTIEDPVVIAVDRETVTFTVGVEVRVGFTATFHFFAVDNVDRDEIPLGASEAYVEQTVPLGLTITADRSVEIGLGFQVVEIAKRAVRGGFRLPESVSGRRSDA